MTITPTTNANVNNTNNINNANNTNNVNNTNNTNNTNNPDLCGGEYDEVPPNSTVCWSIDPDLSNITPEVYQPQLYQGTFRVMRDGVLSGEIDIYFLIPAQNTYPSATP